MVALHFSLGGGYQIRKAIIKRWSKLAVVHFVILFVLFCVLDLIRGDVITWMNNVSTALLTSIIPLLYLSTDIRLQNHSGNTEVFNDGEYL